MSEPRDWHHSHNVSDSMWRCYGCGKEAGDEKLYEPCPTPDAVGKMAIEYELRNNKQDRPGPCPCERSGLGCVYYSVGYNNGRYYTCKFTGNDAYVPVTGVTGLW